MRFCTAWGSPLAKWMGKRVYREITHDYALAAGKALAAASPDASFHFISGSGTRSDSRMMWARVKAETETALGRYWARRPGVLAPRGDPR